MGWGPDELWGKLLAARCEFSASRPPPLPPPSKYRELKSRSDWSLPRRCSEGRMRPPRPGGGGRALSRPAPHPVEGGNGSLLWGGGEFSAVSSSASFNTLLIEALHVQFKKPSVGQAGKKKGKPLLMRKGNLVPLSLPAGGHRDVKWYINPPPPPPCRSGLPASSHAPSSWHPGEGTGGLAFLRPLCFSSTQGLFCTAWVRCSPGLCTPTGSLSFSPGL